MINPWLADLWGYGCWPHAWLDPCGSQPKCVVDSCRGTFGTLHGDSGQWSLFWENRICFVRKSSVCTANVTNLNNWRPVVNVLVLTSSDVIRRLKQVARDRDWCSLIFLLFFVSFSFPAFARCKLALRLIMFQSFTCYPVKNMYRRHIKHYFKYQE